MTEHLPECCFAPHVCDVNLCQLCHAFCICNQLRVCEERVLNAAEAIARKYVAAVAEAEQSAFDRCHLILTEERREAERSTWDRAYAAALDAAREAVKGVNWFNDEGKMLSAIVATAESLAAIDALKEKQ